MNIFAVHESPVAAAMDLADQHVVKMATETAQILSTVCRLLGVYRSTMYAPTHRRHPVVLWAKAHPANWSWLAVHGMALCWEYSRRYGRVHASSCVIRRCRLAL